MPELLDPIAAVRRFNRFYTQAIGVLDRGHMGTPYTLAESRVVYEIGSRGRATPKAVGASTGLDAGYLSRILKRFEAQGLVARAPSSLDGRSVTLSLTPQGQRVFATLEQRTAQRVEGLIGGMDREARQRLTGALSEVERLLRAPPAAAEVTLRPPRIGDMGWVIHRHAVLYAREYGWNERFEAAVARIVADFMDGFDEARAGAWIAELRGEVVGSVFLQPADETTAKLRLLLVEPQARGLGIGARLVAECVGFARAAGYEAVTLWTQDVLTSARRIYAAAGFERIESWPNDAFGPPMTSETWRLVL